MSNTNPEAPSLDQYLLVALIDIYRGLQVNLPVNLDIKAQQDIIRDVLSSAISYAEKQESMQTLSEELFQCARVGCTLKEQMELIQQQSPDVINAKMLSAAYLLKLQNKEMNL